MTDLQATRRQFLRGAAGIGTAGLIPTLGWAAAGSPHYLAAAGLPDGGYCLVGLSGEGEETFRIALPDRGHAAAAHPKRPEAVAFARRPGTFALVIDCAAGAEVARLAAPEGRHFYGHGAFSADGATLFTTENDIAAGAGRVGVWDAADGYRRIGEVASGGSGPHEIRLMPGGGRLAVANGGIETDPTSGRAELNLATMRANLAYLDAGSGALAEVLELPEALRLNSIRHIAAGRDGTLAAAMQWQGRALEAPPLLALHRPGGTALELLAAAPDVQRRTRNYAGSVAVADDGGHAAITTPRGGMMLVFDLRTGEVEIVSAADICGVAAADKGFACSTGEGRFLAGVGGKAGREVRHARLAFDNHLVRI